MSDALLTEISNKLGAIHAALTKGGAANNGGAVVPKPAATPAANKPGVSNPAGKPAPAAPAAAKPAVAKPGAAKAAAAAAATAAANTKAPGGKYTLQQVRDIIRKVATDASLGGQSAKDILTDDGGGVTRATDLKPENYDAVYEACQVLLSGEGGGTPAASAEDDLM